VIGIRSEFEDIEITKKGQVILKRVTLVLFFYFIIISGLHFRQVHLEHKYEQLKAELIYRVRGQREYQELLNREEFLKVLVEDETWNYFSDSEHSQ
jgi:hypothetical protein